MAQNQNQASVKTLQDSPLFQLSLTSKELFHSNFLYWLGVTYRDLFKETFSNLGCRTAAWPEDWTVEREYKAAKSISLDLCVKGPGKNGKIYLILENKVKSIPNQQQLNRYTSYWERDNEKPCFVLLSLMTTGTSAVTVPVEVWIILLPTVNLTTVFLPVNVTVRFASLHTMSESETPHAFAI